jgi:hypothetical protein
MSAKGEGHRFDQQVYFQFCSLANQLLEDSRAGYNIEMRLSRLWFAQAAY